MAEATVTQETVEGALRNVQVRIIGKSVFYMQYVL